MWRFFFQRNRRDDSSDAEVQSLARTRRRQRRTFAIAEALESRALLSATGSDSSQMTPADLLEKTVPVSAEIMVVTDTSSEASSGKMWKSSILDSSFQFAAESSFGVGGGSLKFSEGALRLSDGLFASTSLDAPAQRLPSVGISSLSPVFSDALSATPVKTVELRFAESGQLVSVGSASAVQIASGLVVADDASPTTYLQTVDADGQVRSRLVFVTRASSQLPVSQEAVATDMTSVVVADAESSIVAISEELASRPDLHDFETALDHTDDSTTSPPSQTESLPQQLAAATRTRWMTSTKSLRSNSPASDRSTESKTGHERHTAVFVQDNDDSLSETNAAWAAPVFDSTTRNVVLSICLVGSLARANARRRRRQKAAYAA